MTAPAREWTVLITVAQAESQPAISDDQARRILDWLGPDDAWIQYPPASGRGHGFETRWWQDGGDAASVAADKWFARWRSLPAVLRWLLVGSPSNETFGPGMRGAPAHALLTGYVARELGEGAVARRHLERAAAAYRAVAEERRARATGDETGFDAWVERLEADATG